MLYTRRSGEISEHNLEPDPLLRYDTPDVRRAISQIAREVVPGVAVQA